MVQDVGILVIFKELDRPICHHLLPYRRIFPIPNARIHGRFKHVCVAPPRKDTRNWDCANVDSAFLAHDIHVQAIHPRRFHKTQGPDEGTTVHLYETFGIDDKRIGSNESEPFLHILFAD